MERIRWIILFAIWWCTVDAVAQVNRYMVFFKDKTGTPYSVSNPSAFLTDKAIQRRAAQNIAITFTDLPVNPNYIAAVGSTGATVHYRTKWMNGVLVSCDASVVPSIEALGEVSSVVLVAPGSPPNGGRVKSVKHRTSNHEGVTASQLSMIGLNDMHADGYRGEGITIAVFDSGFTGVDTAAPFAHLFTDGRIDLAVSYDFVHGSQDIFMYDNHGTRVLSVMGAFQDNVFVGGVYNASFQLYLTEDVNSEYRIEEYNWLFAAERADSSGVDIINSSLGYNLFDNVAMNYTTSQMNGGTSIVTLAAQTAADRGLVVVTSAGNEGSIPSWKIITAPGDAIDVLAVGNVNSFGQRNTSSSTGPTADGRIKPDVMALGSGVSVIRSNGTTGSGSGTSFSSPLVASLTAGLWQRYPMLTNKELMDVIRSSASMASSPDNLMGYGIPHYRAAINYLEQAQQPEPITLFPNPVSADRVMVRPKDPELFPRVHISLIGLQGQVLQEQWVDFNWLTAEYPLELEGVAIGLYIVRIHAGNSVFLYRLIRL